MSNEELVACMVSGPPLNSGYTKEDWEQLRNKIKNEITDCPYCSFKLPKYWIYIMSKYHISGPDILLLRREQDLEEHIKKCSMHVDVDEDAQEKKNI